METFYMQEGYTVVGNLSAAEFRECLKDKLDVYDRVKIGDDRRDIKTYRDLKLTVKTFRDAKIYNCLFKYCDFDYSKFYNCEFYNCIFQHSTFYGCKFENIKQRDCFVYECVCDDNILAFHFNVAHNKNHSKNPII